MDNNLSNLPKDQPILMTPAMIEELVTKIMDGVNERITDTLSFIIEKVCED